MAGVNQTAKATSGVAVVLGIWLIASPVVLDYSGMAASWNDILVGTVVAIVGGLTMARPVRWFRLSWINVVLGVWLILSPFVLRYGDDYIVSGVNKPLWNDLSIGIPLVMLGWLNATLTERPRSR